MHALPHSAGQGAAFAAHQGDRWGSGADRWGHNAGRERWLTGAFAEHELRSKRCRT